MGYPKKTIAIVWLTHGWLLPIVWLTHGWLGNSDREDVATVFGL